jgi:hypothetical protein
MSVLTRLIKIQRLYKLEKEKREVVITGTPAKGWTAQRRKKQGEAIGR